MVYQMPKFFPTPEHENLAISVTGVGNDHSASDMLKNIPEEFSVFDVQADNQDGTMVTPAVANPRFRRNTLRDVSVFIGFSLRV